MQVSEERLISLLEQINTQTTKQTKVTVSLNFYLVAMLQFSSLTCLCLCLTKIWLLH